MVRHFVTLGSLFFGFGLLMIAHGLLSTLVALRMGIEDFPLESAGAVLSAYAIGFLIGPYVVPQLIERIGHIRFFAALAALAAVTALAHPLAIHPAAWMAIRGLTGFALAGAFMIIESWLNTRATTSERGTVFSVYMVVNYLGFGGSQFLLNVGSPAGFKLFSLAGILFALALVPFALTRIEEPERIAARVPNLARLWRMSPLGTLGCFTTGFTSMAFTAAGPLFASAKGLETASIAAFMGFAIMAGLALQWPMGWLSDRADRRRLIAGVGIGIAGASAVVVLASTLGAAVMVAAGILYGGIAYTLYPLAVAHANDMAAPDQAIELSAGLVFSFGAGAVLGPITATVVMEILGADGLFVTIAAAALALAAFTVWRMARGAPAPAATEEHAPFVPMAEATPGIADLDPRAGPGEAPNPEAR